VFADVQDNMRIAKEEVGNTYSSVFILAYILVLVIDNIQRSIVN